MGNALEKGWAKFLSRSYEGEWRLLPPAVEAPCQNFFENDWAMGGKCREVLGQDFGNFFFKNWTPRPSGLSGQPFEMIREVDITS